jgi:hypothetical protein
MLVKDMTIDLKKYRLRSRLYFGGNLKLSFQNQQEEKDVKILEMNSIAGFFDHLNKDDELKWLEIRDGGGSYNEDLSIRLRNPELTKNQEVLIFLDEKRVSFAFRCSAEKVQFRDWIEKDKWLA